MYCKQNKKQLTLNNEEKETALANNNIIKKYQL